MNNRTVSILMRSSIPVQQPVQEAAPEPRQQVQYTESREDEEARKQREALQRELERRQALARQQQMAMRQQEMSMRQQMLAQQQMQAHRGGMPQDQLTDPNQAAAAAHDTRAQQPRTPIVKNKMPGRNDPCPCGSGKKFKNCHGRGLV